MIEKNRVDQFLSELAALSAKHGIIIEGCGCCGSPFLLETEYKKGEYDVSSENTSLSWTGE